MKAVKNMNRQERIAAGKLWQICPDKENENVLQECTSETACFRWLKDNGFWRQYKSGAMRIGKVIWEKE